MCWCPCRQLYPGQFIDWAYLPNDSPLIGRVKGSPQDERITSLGVVWRRISYHPHSGGGGPAWNPGLHGFHTYIGELVSWLRRRVAERIQITCDGRIGLLRIRKADQDALEKHVFRRYPDREWGTFFRFGYRRTGWGVASVL